MKRMDISDDLLHACHVSFNLGCLGTNHMLSSREVWKIIFQSELNPSNYSEHLMMKNNTCENQR